MSFKKDPWNVIITGVGGQGNVLASQILAEMLISKGYIITIGETYGASQRGGSVMSHIRISLIDQYSPLIPKGQCDLVVSLEPVETLRVLGQYGNPRVFVLVNPRPIQPMNVMSGEAIYPELSILLEKIKKLSQKVWTINATDLALEMGDPILSNVIMLGALSYLDVLPINREGFHKVAQQSLPQHHIELNMKAFSLGQSSVRELGV